MITPEEWNKTRESILETGTQVHRVFNIGRKVGEYATLDVVRNATKQRLLCYPSTLADGSQPLHSSLMPFSLIRDGSLTDEGIDIREVPAGTKPLLRIAQSFDTPGSGAPQRAEIFRQAGSYLGRLWRMSRFHLPQHFSMEMLSYIPEGNGAVAYVPPSKFIHMPNPAEVFDVVTVQLMQQSFAPDMSELAYEFKAGIKEVIHNKD